MNKTLKLLRKLLNPKSNNQGTVSNHLESPSRVVVGESSGATFKVPQDQNHSPRTIEVQVIVLAGTQSPSFLGPPQTIANLMGQVEAEPASPAASIAQQIVPIPLLQTEVIRSRSKERVVTEEVTHTFQAAPALAVENVANPVR